MVSKYAAKALAGMKVDDGKAMLLLLIANELAEANRLTRIALGKDSNIAEIVLEDHAV